MPFVMMLNGYSSVAMLNLGLKLNLATNAIFVTDIKAVGSQDTGKMGSRHNIINFVESIGRLGSNVHPIFYVSSCCACTVNYAIVS